MNEVDEQPFYVGTIMILQTLKKIQYFFVLKLKIGSHDNFAGILNVPDQS